MSKPNRMYPFEGTVKNKTRDLHTVLVSYAGSLKNVPTKVRSTDKP